MKSVNKKEIPTERKKKLLDEIETLKVLLAVETGDLSEGQAAKFLAIDRVSLRVKKSEYLQSICEEFKSESVRLSF